MAELERLSIPLPLGRRLYVAADLDLGPETTVHRGERALIELLGEIDDPAVVVVAGNLFGPATRGVELLTATLAAHRGFVDAVTEFTAGEGRRFIVLPGGHDGWLIEDEAARAIVERSGAEVAGDIVAQIATADGVRDLAVAAGTPLELLGPVPTDVAVDAARLEDPQASTRLVLSRRLYRRFGFLLLAPVVMMALVDLSGSLVALFTHLTRHHFSPRALHPQAFWNNLLWSALVVGIAEAVVVSAVGYAVRRRFHRRTRAQAPAILEPLAQTVVDGVDVLEYARRIAERGGVGAVVGGASAPALAFLDRGMAATPGPSRPTVVEHRGRLGLPPTFRDEDRVGLVEVEATGTVHVRLYAGANPSPLRLGSFTESLVTGPATRPSPPRTATTVGSWPGGSPFPSDRDAPRAQLRRRTVRRTAAALLFIDGLMNVVVSVVPPLRHRLDSLAGLLPLGVAQTAAALTALSGVALLMLARGVRRGQKRSWSVALLLLTLTTVAHVARAGRLAPALLSVSLVILLLVERGHFEATTDRLGLRTMVPRLALVDLAAVMAATVGIAVSGRHQHLPSLGVIIVGCAERLVGLTTINLPDRVMDLANPALLATGLSTIVAALYLATRPVVVRRLSHAATSTERRIAERRAREIVRRHGYGSLDYFALRDDKQFFFFRDTLVAYAVYGGVALVSPDPVGPAAEATEAFNAFRSFAESRGWTVGVVGAGGEWLPRYHAAGLHSIYLGDEAIVNCTTFSLEGGSMKGVRQACGRVAKKGYTVEFLDPARIDPARVPALLELITKLRRGEAERGFSMMLGRLFDPKDQGLLLTVVSDPSGRPVAVCQFVPSPAINGYSLDLMRRDPGEHPNGLLDFALCETIFHLRDRGATRLSLNFAAFRSVLDGERGEGPFTRIERWALKRLSGVLPIESLWHFNAKYHPTWLPRFLVYPAAESFVPVVASILRAESLTEIPVIGRFLVNDPSQRPGTVVPPEVLDLAGRS